ncbi:MAG: hypothetical protein K0U98_20185 [Deltaproteobacteria bacterium]|nr:hypothetical protein [Deltaproteobacteria bacterium]
MTEQEELNHQAAWNSLPWLANGTLEGEELHSLLDHLKVCTTCRSELSFLPELRTSLGALAVQEEAAPDPAASFRRLMTRIDGEARGLATEGTGFGSNFLQAWRLVPVWGRRLMLAQGTALVVLAVLVLGLPSAFSGVEARSGSKAEPDLGQQIESGQFRTLSDPGVPTLASGLQLRVIFDPETPEGRLRELVRGCGGNIVEGPSGVGVYTVAVSEGSASGGTRDAVAQLRESRDVHFAEWVFPKLPAGQN